MQTTGAALVAVERSSLAPVRSAVQGSRSAHGLLYVAAVPTDWREQEHRQGTVDERRGYCPVDNCTTVILQR